MKIVASFPAFDIIDLEQDVIALTLEQVDNLTGLKFCVSKETRSHGNLYPEVSPNCAAYYAQAYNECPVESEARCDRLGHEKFWLNNIGAMITSSKQPKGIRILLKPGQKMEMYGQLLEVFQKGNSDHYGFKLLEQEARTVIAKNSVVRLRSTVKHHECPEGRVDNKTAVVRDVLSEGRVWLQEDLVGCQWWNLDDLELAN